MTIYLEPVSTKASSFSFEPFEEISKKYLSEVRTSVSREAVQSIISRPDLFKLLFFHYWVPNKKDKKEFKKDHGFSIEHRKSAITLHNEKAKWRPILDFIDALREMILRTEFKSSEEHYQIHNALNDYSVQMALDKQGDVKKVLKKPVVVLSELVFEKMINPSMIKISQLLGFQWVEEKGDLRLQSGTNLKEIQTRKVKIFWMKKRKALTAKKAHALNFQKAFYLQLGDKKFCDVVLLTKGSPIYVHSQVLKAMGGDFFRNTLGSQLKESQQGQIDFSRYSHQTVSIVVSFIYEGPKKVKSKEKEILRELLDFSLVYQMENLSKAVIQLLEPIMKVKDADSVIELGKQHSNDDLIQLGARLKLPKEKD